MSFLGANFPDAAYNVRREKAAQICVAERGPETLNLRALVASHRDWVRAHRIRTFLSHQWRRLFQEWDVLICPVLPTTAFPHDDTEMDRRRIQIDGRPFPYGLQGLWAGPASTCGLPATVMPIAMSGGLPIGVQIIGPYLEDHTTIRFAELAEQEFGGFVPPPKYM
jgi:amidase